MSEAGIRRRWTKRLAARRRRKTAAAKNLVNARRRLNHAKNEVAAALRVLARHPAPSSLRERAYKQAVKFIGVMEQGGNNTGPTVDKIIRANGGVVGEPWCGDFMAWCYQRAGSKGVDRRWASVQLTGSDPDVRETSSPKRGDLVRFTFDHVGMFVRDRGDRTIETIEGNTGSSGAVSDSSTGGDGVYRKVRSKGLVNDYLRVLR